MRPLSVVMDPAPQRRLIIRTAATFTATSTAITTTTQIHSGPGITPLLRFLAACAQERATAAEQWSEPAGGGGAFRSLARQHQGRDGGPPRPDRTHHSCQPATTVLSAPLVAISHPRNRCTAVVAVTARVMPPARTSNGGS